MKTLYQCNPELFEKCKKTLCQEECTMTTFKEYAMRNEFGKPIIAMNDNMSVAVDKTLEQEQKTGRWIIIDDCEQFIAKCSECGRIEDSRMIGKYAYCPNCGARMQEVEE